MQILAFNQFGKIYGFIENMQKWGRSCSGPAMQNRSCCVMQGGKNFRVVVADSRPHFEGRAMLAKLLAHGIPCTYLQLNALCYSMQV